MTLTELQTAAIEAFNAYNDARYAACQIAEYSARIAALLAAPKNFARHGAVSVSVLIPENRTVIRRTHKRFQYRVNGKRVTECEAAKHLA